uniref:hypothetical protein n=1 Tax=unclassified Caballeronia TaxID=2646786 RepID=UPI002029646B
MKKQAALQNQAAPSATLRHSLRVLPSLWAEKQVPLASAPISEAKRAARVSKVPAGFYVHALVAAVWLLSGKVEAQSVLPSTPHVVGGQANIQVNGSHMNVT